MGRGYDQVVTVAGGASIVELALAAVLLGSLTLAAPANAQGDEARARDLFAEGRRDVARGDLEAACDQFSRSHALAPDAVGPLLNLADCDERGGKVATAWRRLTRAAELADDPKQRAYASRRAETLADRVPWLRLEIRVPPPAETTIERDGELVAIGDPGREQAVDPGRYRFVVRAEGYEDHVQEVEVREGERRTVVLERDPLPTPTPPRPVSPAPEPPPAMAVPLPTAHGAPRDDGVSSVALAGWVIAAWAWRPRRWGSRPGLRLR